MNIAFAQNVVETVRGYLESRQVSFAEDVEIVRHIIASGRVPDYEQDALLFAAAYWERNFWKALYYFRYEYIRPAILSVRLPAPGSSIDIVVLGAGSAADTVACLCWLDEVAPLRRITIELIDQSRQQLELARGIIERVLSLTVRPQFDIKYRNMRASEWSPSADSTDLILMGHFLTENKDEKEALLLKVMTALKPRGDMLIIERQRDPVWRWARDTLALNGVTTHEVGLSAEKFALFAPGIPDKEADITPLFVRGSVPENKRLMSLVSRYFQAWLSHSSDALNDIFTSHAVYDEKPGIEAPIVGFDGIRRYWDEHPGRQRNTQLAVHNVAYSDTVSVCSWSGQFDTPKEHVAIRGGMNFYLDPFVGKIHRFTEYFGTVKTPLSA